MTKIAFGTKSIDALRQWVQQDAEAHLTTRYLPKRHAEMAGGSLYWIMDHAIIARSPIIGFEQNPEGRWTIRLEGRLIRVAPKAKRAHQGWRYLEEKNAPRDLAEGELAGDAIPGKMLRKLTQLGLV